MIIYVTAVLLKQVQKMDPVGILLQLKEEYLPTTSVLNECLFLFKSFIGFIHRLCCQLYSST
jgi:hypothetical protein